MAGNVIARWTAPTTRADLAQTPLALSDLARALLETRVDGAPAEVPWSAVAEVPVGTDPAEIYMRVSENVPDGTWHYRLSWFDTGERQSAFKTGTVVVGEPGVIAPPSEAPMFEVVLG